MKSRRVNRNRRSHRRSNNKNHSRRVGRGKMRGGQLAESGSAVPPKMGENDQYSAELSSKQGAVVGYTGGINPNISAMRQEIEGVSPITNHQMGGGYGMSKTMPSDLNVNYQGDGGFYGYAPTSKVMTCGTQNADNLGASKQFAYAIQHQKGGNYNYDNALYAGDAVLERRPITDQLAGELKGSYYPVTSGNRNVCMPMSGGAMTSKSCSKLLGVEDYSRVKNFWKKICPGAVMLYDNAVKQHKKTNKTKVGEIVRKYTRVFCDEVKALESNDKKAIRKYHKNMKKNLGDIYKLVVSLPDMTGRKNGATSQRRQLLKRIEDMHLGRVKKHLQKVMKQKGGMRKGGMKTRKHNKHNKSKRHTRSHRRTMKGGRYEQYESNVATRLGYGLNQKLTPQEAWKYASPMPKETYNHGQDNYIHGVTKVQV